MEGTRRIYELVFLVESRRALRSSLDRCASLSCPKTSDIAAIHLLYQCSQTSEPKHVDAAASTPVAKSKCRAVKRSSSSYPTTSHGMLAMGHSTVNLSSQLNSQHPPHIPAAQFVKQYAARGRRAAVWVCDEAQTIPCSCHQTSGWQRTGGSTGDMRGCASPRLHAGCCRRRPPHSFYVRNSGTRDHRISAKRLSLCIQSGHVVMTRAQCAICRRHVRTCLTTQKAQRIVYLHAGS